VGFFALGQLRRKVLRKPRELFLAHPSRNLLQMLHPLTGRVESFLDARKQEFIHEEKISMRQVLSRLPVKARES
jgi:hypothetical protein